MCTVLYKFWLCTLSYHIVLLSESDFCESCSYVGPCPGQSLDEIQSLTPCYLENHYSREETYAKDTLDEPKRIAKKYASLIFFIYNLQINYCSNLGVTYGPYAQLIIYGAMVIYLVANPVGLLLMHLVRVAIRKLLKEAIEKGLCFFFINLITCVFLLAFETLNAI